MRVFSLKSCDTCRKALRSLAQAGHSPEVIDVRKDGLSDADRREIVAQFGDAALNRASTTWRGLSEADKQSDPLNLLSAHPTLMKRPVIQTQDGWTIGWKADVQAKYLGDAPEGG